MEVTEEEIAFYLTYLLYSCVYVHNKSQ